MKKKKPIIVPPLPKFFKVTEKIEQEVGAWKNIITRVSHRIVIIDPQHPKFNLEKLESDFKTLKGVSLDIEEIDIPVWPKKEQVAFVVCLDLSLPTHKPLYLSENAIVFCFSDFAFTIDDLEQNDWGERLPSGISFSYDFDGTSCYKWKDKLRFLRYQLEQLQKQVPALPESGT